MMSMMQNFFSIRKDSRDLFEGVKITEHKEFCQKWMNQYPVLFISFKDVEADHFHEPMTCYYIGYRRFVLSWRIL